MRNAMKVTTGLLLWGLIGLVVYACATAPDAPPPPQPAGPSRLSNASGGTVVVWRDADKMREGFRLLDAGVHRSNPGLLMPLVTCMPSDGTEIVVVDRGMLSSTVTVVAGRDAGCRGVVPNEWISRPR